MTAPWRENIVARFTQTTTSVIAMRIQVSQGWASGHIGRINCQWSSIGSNSPPRAALKIGVTRMAMVMQPARNSGKFYSV